MNAGQMLMFALGLGTLLQQTNNCNASQVCFSQHPDSRLDTTYKLCGTPIEDSDIHCYKVDDDGCLRRNVLTHVEDEQSTGIIRHPTLGGVDVENERPTTTRNGINNPLKPTVTPLSLQMDRDDIPEVNPSRNKHDATIQPQETHTIKSPSTADSTTLNRINNPLQPTVQSPSRQLDRDDKPEVNPNRHQRDATVKSLSTADSTTLNRINNPLQPTVQSPSRQMDRDDKPAVNPSQRDATVHTPETPTITSLGIADITTFSRINNPLKPTVQSPSLQMDRDDKPEINPNRRQRDAIVPPSETHTVTSPSVADRKTFRRINTLLNPTLPPPSRQMDRDDTPEVDASRRRHQRDATDRQPETHNDASPTIDVSRPHVRVPLQPPTAEKVKLNGETTFRFRSTVRYGDASTIRVIDETSFKLKDLPIVRVIKIEIPIKQKVERSGHPAK